MSMQDIYYKSPIFFQNFLVSLYGQYLFNKRYKGKLYNQIRADIASVNQLSRKEQEAFQAEKLHAMVGHCLDNVPYYKKLLGDLGLTQNDFTSTSDLKKLPLLTKQEVIKNIDSFKTTNSKPHMVQNTSGSTGTPLSLWVDEYTYKLAMALLIDHEERNGVPFGSRRATFAGRMVQPIERTSPPFSRYNKAENQLLFSSYHLNENTFPAYKSELDAFKPLEIIGYPSSIYNLASYYEQYNERPSFIPTAIVTNSETLLDWQRDCIERVFGCKVYDYYGTAEYVTFAGQCSHGAYHLHPVIGITEVVHDQTTPEESEEGIIVATSLTNLAMPLLRYKIGDTGREGIGECPCGNPSRHLKYIGGRIDDYIVTSDGRRIGRIDHIFKGLENIKEAQVIQDELEHCVIKVAKVDDRHSINEALLIENLQARAGHKLKVSIQFTNAIERGPNGKFKSVVNNLPKGAH